MTDQKAIGGKSTLMIFESILMIFESMTAVDWKKKICGYNCTAKSKDINYIVWRKNGNFSLACEKHYFLNREKTGWRSMNEPALRKLWARIKFEIKNFFK